MCWIIYLTGLREGGQHLIQTRTHLLKIQKMSKKRSIIHIVSSVPPVMLCFGETCLLLPGRRGWRRQLSHRQRMVAVPRVCPKRRRRSAQWKVRRMTHSRRWTVAGPRAEITAAINSKRVGCSPAVSVLVHSRRRCPFLGKSRGCGAA